MFDSAPVWMWIAGFLLLIGPLVTVHELGHYLVGRWFGVKADVFSIGFGKEVAGWSDSRGTRWKLSAIPLGGYVQFKGDMNPASIPDADMGDNATPEEREGSFHHATLWKRALIVLAGPATNILVALAIFASFNFAYGRVDASNVVGNFAEVSAGRDAGLKVGDIIKSIDGAEVENFNAIVGHVLMFPGKTVSIAVERNGQQLDIPVKIGMFEEVDRFGNSSRVGRIGVYSGPPVITPVGPVEAVSLAVDQSVGLVDMMVTGIKQIIVGDRSVRELGGPIKIAKYSGEQLSQGIQSFVSFAALISLNLAFINLLPIPALDGGHLAFYAAEAVRRKPVGPRGQELAYRTGLALVLALMLFVTINDLVSLPFFGG